VAIGNDGSSRAPLTLTRDTRVLLVSVLIGTTAEGMALPYLFIYLTHVRHISPTWAGLIGAWVGLAGLFLAGPAGSLADRFGSRPVYLGLIGIFALGVLGYAEIHSVWQGFLAATLAAAGGPPLFGTYNTLLASIASERDAPRLFAFGFAVLNLGIGLGSVIGGLIADEHHASSFVLLYLIDGLGSVAGASLILPLRQIGRPLESSEDDRHEHGGYRAVVRDPVFRRFLLLGVTLMSVAYGQLEFGFPAFAVDVGGLSTKIVGWAFASNCLTIVTVQVWAANRIEGIRRTRVLAAVALLIGGSWAVLAASSAAHHHSKAIPIIGSFAFAIIFSLGEVLMSPVLPALTNALAVDQLRGRYNALASMTMGVPSVVGPLIAGPLIGNGYWPTWLALVLAGAIAAALISLSLGRHLTAAQDGIAEAVSL
jgi:MFS family permease